jgi:hypothetical protein
VKMRCPKVMRYMRGPRHSRIFQRKISGIFPLSVCQMGDSGYCAAHNSGMTKFCGQAQSIISGAAQDKRFAKS